MTMSQCFTLADAAEQRGCLAAACCLRHPEQSQTSDSLEAKYEKKDSISEWIKVWETIFYRSKYSLNKDDQKLLFCIACLSHWDFWKPLYKWSLGLDWILQVRLQSWQNLGAQESPGMKIVTWIALANTLLYIKLRIEVCKKKGETNSPSKHSCCCTARCACSSSMKYLKKF